MTANEISCKLQKKKKIGILFHWEDFSHQFACEKQQEENGNSLDGDERHFYGEKKKNLV